MLKSSYERIEEVTAICASAAEDFDNLPLPDPLEKEGQKEDLEEVQLGERLSPQERAQAHSLIREKGTTFSNLPGYTLLATHRVETPGQTPLRQPPYRIPESVKDNMRKEIEEMLQLGVIEHSESPWASPVVLVPKRDGTTRFCVDYRRLNDETVSDAYSMPRIDELLDKMARGQYLTTIDLCKGSEVKVKVQSEAGAAPLQIRVEAPGLRAEENMSELTTVLYSLLMAVLTADGLIVTTKAPLISAMRDENVTIPCEFSDFIPGRGMNVQWMKSQNGNRTEVFQYIPGRPQIFRAGYYMEEESEIQSGNAALHISRVQFSDDGEYICTVIVIPDYNEGKSTLEVSAVPSAALIPGDAIRVELGSEKVVSCDISNFYPEDITIRWVRHEKDSTKRVILNKGTCTGDTITNTDGTFSTSSHLTLYPTMGDDGYKYSCVVKHRSLQQDLVKNFTLTVTEREDNYGAVVAAMICTILGMAVLLSAGFLYYQVIKKEPPSVSEITGGEPLIDLSRTTLTCHIMNFKPNDLEISLCLKRRGGEMKEVHTWRSRDLTRVGMDDVEQQRLMNGNVNHTQRPLELDLKADVKLNRSRLLRCISWRRLSTYSCQCSIHITPSFAEDNGAEFSVRVSHPALTEPSSQQRTLQVIGVAPRLLKIFSPPYMTHEVPMMLACPINGFKSKTLHITWLKKDREDQETEIVRWPSDDGADVNDDVHNVIESEHDDKSYSIFSTLKVKPTVTCDDGVKYICRTFHPATSQSAEQALVMAVTAVPVLGPIQQTKGELHVMEEMNLTCKIHSFYPAPIEVTWRTEDGQVLNSTLTYSLPDPAGLYQVTSSMSYCPTLKDLKKTFTCEVRHGSTGVTRKTTWKLEDLISEPTVSDISCIPPSPEPGTSVTFSCDVSDLYSTDLTVLWFRNNQKMSEEKCKKTFQPDPESGTYRGTVEVNCLVTPDFYEQEIRMELNDSKQIIERKFRFTLAGSPVLSDITSEPSDARYGQPVTLRCKVTNAKPKDVEVKWLKSDKPLESGQGVAKQIPEEDGSVSCSLQITATALDYAKAYTCSVKPKNTTATLKKTHYIKLPDRAPKFSDISVRPERPVAGKEATFTATISGFTPDIRVKWYKEFDPFPSDFVTTSDPQIGKDSLCTCSSSLRFSPQDNDHGASIRCEVTHSVTKNLYEQLCTLRLSGRTSDGHLPLATPHSGCQDLLLLPHRPPSSGHLKPPLKTKGIQCLTENPRVGGEVTLTCYVDGCDADHSEFSWRKGMFPIDSGIENWTLEDGSGSFSTVTFTAQETDRDCTMICEVNYNFQIQEEHFTLKLQ
ncbi:uncharacterized protein LOC122920716 [Bufo gargarizans]|uniref:uncharacterized protein LOC122920716 n=1 Tax=Bufo gargarizans TaxID=30331 RepID=UPI001CF435F2|nr:uncharacterized protein LOC122920716 [Bufo gargarizans]